MANVLLLAAVLFAGLVVGVLIGYAIATARWYGQVCDLHRINAALSEQIKHQARRPINLDGNQSGNSL